MAHLRYGWFTNSWNQFKISFCQPNWKKNGLFWKIKELKCQNNNSDGKSQLGQSGFQSGPEKAPPKDEKRVDAEIKLRK